VNRQDILASYKRGNLSTTEALERIRHLKQCNSKSALSESQKGLWATEASRPGSGAYNISLCFLLRGELATDCLERAVLATLQRHAILISRITEDETGIARTITPVSEFRFARLDVSEMNEAEVQSLLEAKAKEPFALGAEPLVRASVLNKGGNAHILLLVFHHIVFDGGSIGPVLECIFHFYDCLAEGREPEMALPGPDYSDYVESEQAYLASNAAAEDSRYWRKQLSGELPVLQVARLPQTPGIHVRGRTVGITLPTALGATVRNFCSANGVGAGVLFLAAFKALLHRYTGETDIIVGLPVPGRPSARFERVIGNFVNMTAVRDTVSSEQKFLELLRSVQLTVADAIDHGRYPFHKVASEVGIAPSIHSPVFQAAFEYQDRKFPDFQVLRSRYGGIGVEAFEGLHQEGQYELTLKVGDREGGFVLNLDHDSVRFDQEFPSRFLRHFGVLLEAAIAVPTTRISRLPIFDAAESEEVLVRWNSTKVERHWNGGVLELIEDQVRRNPDALAVSDGREKLTYRDLDIRSNQIARTLRQEGGRPEAMVGLLCERSTEMAIGLLGILKAGAAYLPLDPAQPPERMRCILEESRPVAVLYHASLFPCLPAEGASRTLRLDLCEQEGGGLPDLQPRALAPENLAYVIYTSGSTGGPKGVLISHAALFNLACSQKSIFGLGSASRVLQFAPCSFDASIWEIVMALCSGASLHLSAEAAALRGASLAELLRRERITIATLPPAVLPLVCDETFPHLETLIVAGDICPIEQARLWRSRCRVVNAYGPTETTVCATLEEFTHDGEPCVSIGTPIPNTEAYVLDGNLNPVPIGSCGELYVAGAGLARGYLGRSGVAAKSFIANPFGEPGSRIYRTGDRVRHLPDGRLEFVGRVDRQIKVRGFRVELDEIEAALRAHPGVKDCAVTKLENQSHRQLIAYVVPKRKTEAPEDLRGYLQQYLPAYMVPAAIYLRDALPFASSGKIDRRALSERVEPTKEVRAGFRTESELQLAVLSVLKQVLKLQSLGPDDGFLDSGGDSISAVIASRRIASELAVKMDVTTFIDCGSARGICRHLSAALVRQSSDTPRAPAEEPQAEEPRASVSMSNEPADHYMNSIALIGMSCIFPGAADHREFWKNLCSATESIEILSPQYLREQGIPEALIADPKLVAARAVISNRECFDAEFFRISRHDAEIMDPQMRLLLQHAWKAVEDAGYTPDQLGPTGVFMSATNNGYNASAPEHEWLIVTGLEAYAADALAQSGTIPTLVSHKLGLTGPSIFVHSNCSSSLVALEAACRCLRTGDVKAALVGAASVCAASPLGYRHEDGMNFSSDGHLRAFDERADGMVSGEGVGVILIKSARDAVRDGDHIYALIRGIAVNNDGADKAGYYAPSARGQSSVIAKALSDSGVEPCTIDYVEAHGTATRLGDPLEFAALKEAYGPSSIGEPTCGLGSVKSNIGHLDTAAGIAGTIKAALTLESGVIPPTLHFSRGNPAIDLSATPFYVVSALTRWRTRERAHRAAVSSFGIGGTNAHAILEQYPQRIGSGPVREPCPCIVPLSARNPERLREYCEELLRFLKLHPQTEVANIAFTLQVGRVGLATRVAFVVETIEALVEKLGAFVANAASAVGVFYTADAARSDLAGLSSGEAACLLDHWLEAGDISQLARFWTSGMRCDWNKLHARRRRPDRISLPTYPFAKDRYWLTRARTAVTAVTPVAFRLHALVHQNTSDLWQQRFTSEFTGNEFFLCDHFIGGRHIVPAVVLLEMARAAVVLGGSPESLGPGTHQITLKDTVWLRPIASDGAPLTIHTRLSLEDSGDVSFEIYNGAGQGDVTDREMVHCEGRATIGPAAPRPWRDRTAICDLRVVLTHTQCYALFQRAGGEYGPSMRAVEEISVGKEADGSPIVLARLRLPGTVAATTEEYFIHPALMDAALQASIGFSVGAGAPTGESHVLRPAMPFSLQRMELFAPCGGTGWAWVRQAHSGENVETFEIDLCDDAGQVCVRMGGFASRSVEPDVEENLLLLPVWEESTPAPATECHQESPLVVAGGFEMGDVLPNSLIQGVQIAIQSADSIEEIASNLQAVGGNRHIIYVPSPGASGGGANQALICFRLLKALLRLGYDSRDLELTILTWQAHAVFRDEPVHPDGAALHGLAGSVAKEYPNWSVRVVDLPAAVQWPDKEVLGLPTDPEGNAWALRAGHWYRQRLLPAELRASAPIPYREAGTYVVVGGAGGIGEAWTEYMLRQYGAHVTWIGRRRLDADISDKISRLSLLGPAPLYLQADAADHASLESAFQEVRSQRGAIHGVVHSAITLLDSTLLNMDEDRFRRSLASKIDSTIHLARVIEHDPLDFLLFFSSLQSFSKAAGQSNYSAGCTFVDAYAHSLRQMQRWPVKIMNWGYWGSRGIVSGKSYRDRMTRGGVGSIEPEQAMRALEVLMAGPCDQLALLSRTGEAGVAGLGISAHEFLTEASGRAPACPHVPELGASGPGASVPDESWEAAPEDFDASLAGLLYCQLRQLGFLTDPTDDPARNKEVAGFQQSFDRWRRESVRILSGMGYLKNGDGGTLAADSVSPDGQHEWHQWDERSKKHLGSTAHAAQIRLAERALRSLPEVLTGRLKATDVIFPGASTDLIDPIYQGNRLSDFYNSVLARGVRDYVGWRAQVEAEPAVRILEIGAGTGATSAQIFASLAPLQQAVKEYCYTDISRAFLLHAEEKFLGSVPYLQRRLFNVELSPETQSVEQGQYDVAVATNVLHATRNIRDTIRNVKALLKRDGLLFINEMSGSTLFAHLTFGLLDGWWKYEDASLRVEGSPGIASETWARVLREEGFHTVSFPAAHAHQFGQQVIVAVSDGVLRARRASAMPRSEKSTRIGDVPRPLRQFPVVQLPHSEDQEAGASVALPRIGRAERNATQLIMSLVATTLRVPVEQIDPREPLETYGIDSILAIRLANALRGVFTKVNSTVFFEHRTIETLVAHYRETERERLLELADPAASSKAKSEEKPESGAAHLLKPILSGNGVRTDRLNKQRSAAKAQKTGIAIIGMSARYPQAEDLKEYWERLRSGTDCISEIPEERWPMEEFFESLPSAAVSNAKSYCKWGGFLRGIDEFDTNFFRLSPREALSIDPHERLCLQQSWLALEDAGYTRHTLEQRHGGRVGVFVGISQTGFELHGTLRASSGEPVLLHTSFASVANRISYFLNLNGPSLPVDTMCSSSLTALHEACEHLIREECQLALVAGVNLYLHPSRYISLSAGRVLSASGRCRSFGKDADGMVPGEGVGVLLLKPLSAALADGDRVQAVVRATSINHGGKTNGYTVPSLAGQRELIGEAIRKARVPARAITYVEAHGTGTELGDPIEVAALSEAFEKDTNDTQFCAIGSVKANIGHLEAAAGLAGVMKVVLQMRYGLLVPSLHANQLNPHIDFKSTPFSVQRVLGKWERPMVNVDGVATQFPRLAGVSSFGAGGANAHVILEEFEQQPGRPGIAIDREQPEIFPLSAMTGIQLQQQATQLLRALKRFGESDLHDIAYTLQVGREQMKERLAMSARSIGELERKLEGYLRTQDDADVFAGHSDRTSHPQRGASPITDAEREVASLLLRFKNGGACDALLRCWVDSPLELDWGPLHAGLGRRRVELPTYPFLREKIPLPQQFESYGGSRSAVPNGQQLHPLLHRNTSGLAEVRFSSQFTGDEFTLDAHRVAGSKVFPAVAFLEMVRAALERAGFGERVSATGRVTAVRIEDVLWLRPVTFGSKPIELHTRLTPAAAGRIRFEVYQLHGTDSGGSQSELLHAEGFATDGGPLTEPAIDIQALLERTTKIVPGSQCYAHLLGYGLEYGDSFRALAAVHIGKDIAGVRFALGRLSLPESTAQSLRDFHFHPSIGEGALQTSVGLEFDGEDPADPATNAPMPFSLAGLECFAPCSAQAWALVRPSSSAKERHSVDIDILDDKGHVCVQLRGLASSGGGMRQAVREASALAFHVVTWEPRPLAAVKQSTGKWPEQYAVLCGIGHSIEALQTLDPARHWIVLETEIRDVAHRFEYFAEQMFQISRKILSNSPRVPVLVQVVVPASGSDAVLAGLSGLVQSTCQENPKLHGQLIGIEACSAGDTLKVLCENALQATTEEVSIRYERGERRSRRLTEVMIAPDTGKQTWRDNGVYMVTGGTGALGFKVACTIARIASAASLVLVGRSRINAKIKGQLDELRDLGAQVRYVCADLGDIGSVSGAVEQVEGECGTIHGILHCAGHIRDNFVQRKSTDEFRSVLAAKVAGTQNLDEATRHIPLDLFVTFSSRAALDGGLGQTDYAAANAFMDAYVHNRQQAVSNGERSGRSLTINWPYWADGGMRVADDAVADLRAMGEVPLETTAGLNALLAIIHSEFCQVAVISRSTVEVSAEISKKVDSRLGIPEHALEPESDLKLAAIEYLRRRFAQHLMLGIERLQADTPFANHGVDSILALRIVAELEKDFGPLPKTLLFEHQNVSQVAEYLIEAHQEELAFNVLRPGGHRTAAPQKQSFGSVPGDGAARDVLLNQAREPPLPQPQQEDRHFDIAIIGLAGRYPKARNMGEFWENLKSGRDCVTEVPAERWDHSKYFDPTPGRSGKTYSRWGGFIDGMDEFDPQLFNISRREAPFVDPQERQFLMCVHEVLEDAGYTRESVGGDIHSAERGANVGVFVGVMYSEYPYYGVEAQARGEPLVLGGSVASIANRASYCFNFTGPSLAMDTMCSSSLTAIHVACLSIVNKDCELAIAGGVNLTIHPNKFLGLAQARFASGAGRCASFGRGGDGYVPGEGVGAVLLKPLQRAISDRDHIYAVVKGSSINHGGRTNGYTVPNPAAQAQVIRTALARARMAADAVTYIEAHGTGTSLGDPIEIAGLAKVFTRTKGGLPYRVGSVKSNIGHCESAAGIAGLTKVLLQMKHRMLVPSLHASELNEHIDFKGGAFRLQRELEEWTQTSSANGPAARLAAAVSSFGAGGSNAHLIVEEYLPPADLTKAWVRPALVVLSAKSKEQLRMSAARLLDAIQGGRFKDSDLESIAYTLQTGRQSMDHRLGMEVSSLNELRAKLAAFGRGDGAGEGSYYGVAVDEGVSVASPAAAKGIMNDWIAGRKVDWLCLYEDKDLPRRVELPTYPFARERYWAPTGHADPGVPAAPSTTGDTCDASAFVDLLPLEDMRAAQTLTTLAAVQEAKASPQPLRGESTAPQAGVSGWDQAALAAELRATLAAALYLDISEIGLDRSFVDLGLDSVIGVEWIHVVNKRLGTSVAATKLYQYPTVRELSAFLTKIVTDPVDELVRQVYEGRMGLQEAQGLLNGFDLTRPPARSPAN
jgi:amino acid adenylation domain-containing protein